MTKVRGGRGRRGMALIIAVTIISVTNLVVLGALTASGDDSRVGGLRTSTIRAFYASESGVRLCVRQYMLDSVNPLVGTLALPGPESVEVIDPFDASPAPAGTLIVEGSHGIARRRVQVDVE